MPKTRREDVAELLGLALNGLDMQIADLQEKRAQLAAMIGGQPAGPAMRAAAPRKKGGLSAAGRAKISAAAKARWARERKEKAKASKLKPITKKAQVRAKVAKVPAAPVRAKKSPAKKGRSKSAAPVVKAAA